MKKITKRERFVQILAIPAIAENADLTAFIQHEIELLDKKNSGEKKMTPQQEANAVIKANVLALAQANPDRLFTIGEFLKEVSDLPEDMTSQRMTAIVRQMCDNHLLIRVEEKRKAYFKLAK